MGAAHGPGKQDRDLKSYPPLAKVRAFIREKEFGKMKRFTIRQGNNMPVQSPLIPDPFVPYQCKNNKILSVVCRGDRRVIDRWLKPTPFESVGDRYIVSVADFSNCDKASYMDAAIVLPIKFRNKFGGYYFFEYENNDSAIAAGRDLWGYPKKYAAITLEQQGKKVVGKAVRNGVTIMDISCDLSKPMDGVPSLKLTPHLNMHVQPRPDGPGMMSMRIIERDTSPDYKLKSQKFGAGRVTLRSIPSDPLAEFQPKEILGATYIVGDFYATEKNGWGKTIATFKPKRR
ncbi:MAG: acetoacetate decarboxylase family protein [Alphaproteobacteria bacterium]|nr:acetoacetate decarboxylase family protein [Alphaproteobacteria bacterium]